MLLNNAIIRLLNIERVLFVKNELPTSYTIQETSDILHLSRQHVYTLLQKDDERLELVDRSRVNATFVYQELFQRQLKQNGIRITDMTFRKLGFVYQIEKREPIALSYYSTMLDVLTYDFGSHVTLPTYYLEQFLKHLLSIIERYHALDIFKDDDFNFNRVLPLKDMISDNLTDVDRRQTLLNFINLAMDDVYIVKRYVIMLPILTYRQDDIFQLDVFYDLIREILTVVYDMEVVPS